VIVPDSGTPPSITNFSSGIDLAWVDCVRAPFSVAAGPTSCSLRDTARPGGGDGATRPER
jgi:hypothetical protein